MSDKKTCWCEPRRVCAPCADARLDRAVRAFEAERRRFRATGGTGVVPKVR